MKTSTLNAAIPLGLAWLAIVLDMAHAGAFSGLA